MWFKWRCVHSQAHAERPRNLPILIHLKTRRDIQRTARFAITVEKKTCKPPLIHVRAIRKPIENVVLSSLEGEEVSLLNNGVSVSASSSGRCNAALLVSSLEVDIFDEQR